MQIYTESLNVFCSFFFFCSRVGRGRCSSLSRVLFLGWLDKLIRYPDWNQKILGIKRTRSHHNRLRRLPEKSCNSETGIRSSRLIFPCTAQGELGRRLQWLANVNRHAQIRSIGSVQQQWPQQFSIHGVQHVALRKRESIWQRWPQQKGAPLVLLLLHFVKENK